MINRTKNELRLNGITRNSVLKGSYVKRSMAVEENPNDITL